MADNYNLFYANRLFSRYRLYQTDKGHQPLGSLHTDGTVLPHYFGRDEGVVWQLQVPIIQKEGTCLQFGLCFTK